MLDHQRWFDHIEPLISAFLALVDDFLVPKVAVLHEHPRPLRHTPTVPVSKLPIFLHNCVKYDYTIFLDIQQLIFKFQCRLTSNPAWIGRSKTPSSPKKQQCPFLLRQSSVVTTFWGISGGRTSTIATKDIPRTLSIRSIKLSRWWKYKYASWLSMKKIAGRGKWPKATLGRYGPCINCRKSCRELPKKWSNLRWKYRKCCSTSITNTKKC